MLDYAANGTMFWTPEQLRVWFENGDPGGAAERLTNFLGSIEDAPDDTEAFWRTVGTNLRENRIRLIFVADEIPPSLQRLVEFLNEQMSSVEVLAVQIRQYRTSDYDTGALVPRLIGQTARAQAVKDQLTPTRRRVPWTPDEVVAAIAAADGETTIAEAIQDWALAHPHTKVAGGTGAKEPSGWALKPWGDRRRATAAQHKPRYFDGTLLPRTVVLSKSLSSAYRRRASAGAVPADR